MEAAIIALVLVLGALGISHGRSLRARVLSAALAGALALGLVPMSSTADDPDAHYRPEDRTERRQSRFASSRACRSCHPAEYESWSHTHHRKMTQPARSDTIIPKWEGELEHGGRHYRLFRHEGRHFVDMPAFGTNGDSELTRMVRPIVMTTGSHHQQLFWFPVPWADIDTDPRENEAYQALCSRCHGQDATGGEPDGGSARQVQLGDVRVTVPSETSAGPLLDAALTATDIRRVIEEEDHRGFLSAGMENEHVRFAVQHVVRLQVRDRLMQFPFSYLIEDERWVHEDDTFLAPPEPIAAVEPLEEGWSHACDSCHAVGARFDFERYGVLGVAETADLGIACESCHGAGAAHVARYLNPMTRWIAYGDDAPADDIVNPAQLDPKRANAVCGKCHSEHIEREVALAQTPKRFRPGSELEAYYHITQYQEPPYPAWLAEAIEDDVETLSGVFWRDGTVRVAGRDYNGLALTGCHVNGTMSCMTCHSMHDSDPDDQLKTIAKTDEVCKSCHEAIARDITAHTHHAAESSGSDCYNCHMPQTTIGLLKAIRAHRVDSPNATTSATTGRPNACNLCHLDRSLESVGTTLSEWYGQAEFTASRGTTGPKPPAGGAEPSAAVDWLLRGDAVQRALVAWHMGWAPARQASDASWAVPYLAELLDDPYAAVRYIAGHSLNAHHGYEDIRFDYVADSKSRRAVALQVQDRFAKERIARPELWLDNGRLDVVKVAAAKAQRDDTDVTISE